MNKTKKLRKQNNFLDQQILKENMGIYSDMVLYIHSAKISEYEVEMIRHDLIEMILSAQNRGENITSLFTSDYKQFCDEVIQAMPVMTRKEKIIYKLNIIFLLLSILVGINIVTTKEFFEIIKGLITNTAVNWDISISIGSIISMFLIIVIVPLIIQTICKRSFEKKAIVLLLLFVGASVFQFLLILLALYGKNIVFTINLFVACAFDILFFVIHKWLMLKEN